MLSTCVTITILYNHNVGHVWWLPAVPLIVCPWSWPVTSGLIYWLQCSMWESIGGLPSATKVMNSLIQIIRKALLFGSKSTTECTHVYRLSVYDCGFVKSREPWNYIICSIIGHLAFNVALWTLTPIACAHRLVEEHMLLSFSHILLNVCAYCGSDGYSVLPLTCNYLCLIGVCNIAHL